MSNEEPKSSNPNVPPFLPEQELKIYIPSKGDEVLLTRDFTFVGSRYGCRGLYNAMGLIHKEVVTKTYGHNQTYTHKVDVLNEGVAEKVQFTLVAGCILALDRLEGYSAKMRVTFAPKEQGFVKKRLRPIFEIPISEVNNRLFCLPAEEPDDLEDEEEIEEEEGI